MIYQPDKHKGIIFFIEKALEKEEFEWIQSLGNLEIDTEESRRVKVWTDEKEDIEAIRRKILNKLCNKLKSPPTY